VIKLNVILVENLNCFSLLLHRASVLVLYESIQCSMSLWSVAGLPSVFDIVGHFHMMIFIAGHKRFCDVTISYYDVRNPLISIGFMR